MSKKTDEQYSRTEAKQRFDAMLKGALKSPPKPLKNIKAATTKRKIATTTKQKTIK